MPFVNVKIIENQLKENEKLELIKKLTDLIVEVMNREKDLTVIVIDEIKPTSWAVGGKPVHSNESVSFVNIKVSKGTTNPDEIAVMQKKTKQLMGSLLKNHIEENYFIIDEINSTGWGFGDITMANRN
ncbi:MAG: 4-oxalocrotonate tautomerase family protein [Spirochaetales bacterium]|nr:4-oxalocrotonate tautomerase family protein [Spirochaetales bacterium]